MPWLVAPSLLVLVAPRPFLWVAFPGVLGGYERVVELALRLGFGGVAPRAGQGGWNDTSLRPGDVRLIRDAGLECLPWVFSEPSRVAEEVEAAHRLEDAGATHYIVDAELPWDRSPDARDAARRYGDAYRAIVRIPVFDAPWPAIDWHPGYPWREFGWVDGRMPQTYWTEIGWGARRTLDVTAAQWAGKDSRLLPIGITYGRREIARLGASQLPPGEIAVEDVRAVGKEILGGWYSAEAAGPGVLEAVAESIRARPARSLDPGVREPGLELGDGSPAVPHAFVEQAERDFDERMEALTDDERAAMLATYCRAREAFACYQSEA